MMNGFLKRAAACMLAVSMLVLSACSGGMQPGGSSLPDGCSAHGICLPPPTMGRIGHKSKLLGRRS